jgi:hypothetical protein
LAEKRAGESLNLKKEQSQFKKEVFQTKQGGPLTAEAPRSLNMAA